MKSVLSVSWSVLLAACLWLQMVVPIVRAQDYSLADLDGAYTLSIEIDPSAVPNIRRQMLSLVVSKGFHQKGITKYNTAWITENSANLIAGSVTYSWLPVNKAAFALHTSVGRIIRDQKSTISPEFAPRDMVTYDGVSWKRELALPWPQIGVTLDLSNPPMHPVLKSPFVDAEGNMIWSTYYYSEAEMAGSVLTGTPSYTLMLQMKKDISTETFIGDITGTELFVTYSVETDNTVCLYTESGEKVVRLKHGPC